MLRLNIPDMEMWDERKQEFVYSKGANLQLEHSLVSLSKWESKWNKPFLSKTPKTDEEMLDYIKCMTITQNVPDKVYETMPASSLNQINKYIEAPMTATWFNEVDQPKGKGEIVTGEVIYYWMIALNIPFECEKWHLNRLLTLIKVCNAKNQPKKKMSMKEIAARNKAINEANKRKFNSKG